MRNTISGILGPICSENYYIFALGRDRMLHVCTNFGREIVFPRYNRADEITSRTLSETSCIPTLAIRDGRPLKYKTPDSRFGTLWNRVRAVCGDTLLPAYKTPQGFTAEHRLIFL